MREEWWVYDSLPPLPESYKDVLIYKVLIENCIDLAALGEGSPVRTEAGYDEFGWYLYTDAGNLVHVEPEAWFLGSGRKPRAAKTFSETEESR